MNQLMYQQIDELLTKSNARELLECERALRVGAATLRLGRSGEITATTVVCNIADDAIDAVESLVGEIADEYGLEATIRRQQPGSYSVRFTWPSAVEALDAISAKPLLARLLGR